MSKIIVENINCHLEENDIEFLRALDDELSFKITGAEYTWAFKQQRWDGVHRILSRNLRFPYGLLTRVQKFYIDRNRPYELINQRLEKTEINPIDITENLIKINRNPYPYQLEVLDKIKVNDCGIIRSCTGSGKTLIAAMMAAYFGKKTILYVIGKDLLHQTHKFFSNIFDQEIGIVGDGICEIRDLNIVSVWTIGQALGLENSKILLDNDESETILDKEKYKNILDLMRTAKVHMFDECHSCSCDTIQEIAKNINPEYVYGMSASPWRDDGADLLIEGIFGSTIIDITASRLIRDGYLAKPYIRFLEVPKLKEKLPKTYPGIYKNYIVTNPVRNNMIITAAERLVEQKFPTLVLYNTLKHGKALYEEISKNIPTSLLSGKDSSNVRLRVKEELESGKIKCIVASTIFDIGVDLPSLSGLVIASGGKSSVRACQRIGRVIRKYDGKEFAAVIDFYDQAKFLKDHSIARRNVYCREEEFDVKWRI